MNSIGLYYYSYEGFTDRLMQVIEGELRAKIATADHLYRERLVPIDEKQRSGMAKYLWGGREALMGHRPRLEPMEKAPAPHSILVIAGPIWAFTYPPPLGSFIETYDLSTNRLALLLTHEGGPGQAMDKLQSAVEPARIISTAMVRNRKKQKDIDTTAVGSLIDAVLAEYGSQETDAP